MAWRSTRRFRRRCAATFDFHTGQNAGGISCSSCKTVRLNADGCVGWRSSRLRLESQACQTSSSQFSRTSRACARTLNLSCNSSVVRT